MTFTFRTDASLEIGSGHIMRCLTLAGELRQDGANVMFVCREHNGNLIDMVESKGYPVVRLQRPEAKYVKAPDDVVHAAWLGVSWHQDAVDSAAAIKEIQPEWLIVDHYALDRRWERVLRPYVGRIMVIDDLADRPHDCDLLLNQNLGSKPDVYKSILSTQSTLLLGPQYALLRPEFAALREYSLRRRQKPHCEKLFISMGGVDKDNATGKVLDALKDCRMPADFRITVVMGPVAPWLDCVRQQAETLVCKVEVKVNVAKMAQLMADSDLAIGAAGSTSWERCCLGLPTIMLTTASNQEMAARRLEQTGAVILLERDWQQPQLQSILQSVISSSRHINKMIVSASKITNGKGARAVLKFLMA